jgi:hypothetical protein
MAPHSAADVWQLPEFPGLLAAGLGTPPLISLELV